MISIIIPSFNKSTILFNTIKMVLKQTYDDMEIIIVDDASTDNTYEVVASFKNKKIIYVKHPKRLGTTQARITGLKRASGRSIAFLDDDDNWANNKLELQNNCLNGGGYDLVLCNYVVNNLINNTVYKICLKKYKFNFQQEITSAPGPFFQCCLFNKNYILQHINKFDQKSEPSEDWDFFINIASEKPKIGHVDQFLFTWNFSKKSQSYNYRREWEAIEYIIIKNKKIFTGLNSVQNLSLQYRRIASYMYKLHDYKKFRHYYSLAFRVCPWSFINISYRILLLFPQQTIKYFMSFNETE